MRYTIRGEAASGERRVGSGEWGVGGETCPGWPVGATRRHSPLPTPTPTRSSPNFPALQPVRPYPSAPTPHHALRSRRHMHILFDKLKQQWPLVLLALVLAATNQVFSLLDPL